MFTFSPNPDSYLYELPLLHICRQHISLEKLSFGHRSVPYENTGILDDHSVSGDSQSWAFRAPELGSVEWWGDILPTAVLYVSTRRCILIQSHWKCLMYTISSSLSPSIDNIKQPRRQAGMSADIIPMLLSLWRTTQLYWNICKWDFNSWNY